MNTQPSAGEQATVNVMFIEGDQFFKCFSGCHESRQDPVLSKVLQYSQKGWPDNPVLQLYYSRRRDLT